MTTRNLELNLRARADTRDIERLGRETDQLSAALRRSSAAFEEANNDARKLAQTYGQLSQEEREQIQAASKVAAAVSKAAEARERAAAAAANAATAEGRALASQQQVEQAALRTAAAEETLAAKRAATETSVTRAAQAEEKLAQERQRTFQSTAKSEKVELDVARAREQLRVATVRAEQAERRMAETRKSSGLATDIVRKQVQALVAGGALLTAGRQLLQFGRDSVMAASDAEEASAKFEQVFGTLAGGVRDDLQEMADSNRRFIGDLTGFASTLQNTFVPLGFAREEAAGLSKTITQLAIDLAAFNNSSDAEAVEKLTSAIVGNHEAVRSYGIVITETVLKQELARMGALELTGAQLEVAKAQARLNVIMRSTSDAQGAAVREAGSYSNTLKAWDASIQSLKVSLGTGLLPLMTELTDTAIRAVNVLSAGDAFKAPVEASVAAATSIEDVVEAARESDRKLNNLDFWGFLKVNSTSFVGLDLAERQITRIGELSSDVGEFQKTILSEFSRMEISTLADSLGVDQSWNLEETTAAIYRRIKAIESLGQAQSEAAEMEAVYVRESGKSAAALRESGTAYIDGLVARAQSFSNVAEIAQQNRDAGFAYINELIARGEEVKRTSEAIQAFGEAFSAAPVDDLIAAQQDLQAATGEWRTATIDNSGDIAAIQRQLAADLTAEQKSELQKQLKDLDSFSDEYLAIVGRLEGDLSDRQRLDLSQQLAALEGRQGQTTRAYTGDTEAAEDARDAIIAANKAIQDSYYERAYNSIAARLIEEGNFEQLAGIAVSLGIMTQAEADLRMQYAETVGALDALTQSTAFYGLTAGQQAGAIKSLAAGIYETAAAALQAQQNLQSTQDFFSQAPDSSQIGDYYRGLAQQSGADEGITTTVGVVIDQASKIEFRGYRGELEEYDAAIYKTTVESDSEGAEQDFEDMKSVLKELTDSTWVINVRYETTGAPPAAAGSIPPPGAPQSRSGGRGRNASGAYVDLVVNNYGGGDVGGSVKAGVLAAFRSL